jgi:hypothetical protein
MTRLSPRSGVAPKRVEDGVDDGARTRDRWNHNPELYQLSYVHQCSRPDVRRDPIVARPEGLEPSTLGLEGRCSIRLSYGRFSKCTLTELVGVERFELPTSCSQSRRATRLRYTPIDTDDHHGANASSCLDGSPAARGAVA